MRPARRQGPRPWALRRGALAAAVCGLSLAGLFLCAQSATAWTAYVAAGGESLVPIDTATDTAGTPIAVGRYPAGVAITPDGRTAYAARYFNDTLTPVDTAGGTATTPIAVASENVAISPDGGTAWVTDGEAVAPVAIPGGAIGTPIMVGKARVLAGRSTLVELTPRPAYASRLDAAARILVVERMTIRGRTRTAFRLLPVVGR